LCTGRQVSTPGSHLDAISCISVDATLNFLLTGSKDATVHIWQIPSLMALSNESYTPWKSFSEHRGPITALKTAHGRLSNDFAISTSEDNTCLMWNYRTGSRLATFILPSTPLCVEIDYTDRALYVGYKHSVDHFNLDSLPANPNTPVHRTSKNQLKNFTSALNCIALSFGGPTLITGHEDGSILLEDGSRHSNTICQLGLPISNIILLPPSGHPMPSKTLTTGAITKPKQYESLLTEDGSISDKYTFNATFSSSIPMTRYEEMMEDFNQILEHTVFPEEILNELYTIGSEKAQGTNSHEMEELKKENEARKQHIATLTAELKFLKQKEKGIEQAKKIKRIKAGNQATDMNSIDELS
jgi:pre-rRNA-processing protein IPI3